MLQATEMGQEFFLDIIPKAQAIKAEVDQCKYIIPKAPEGHRNQPTQGKAFRTAENIYRPCIHWG